MPTKITYTEYAYKALNQKGEWSTCKDLYDYMLNNKLTIPGGKTPLNTLYTTLSRLTQQGKIEMQVIHDVNHYKCISTADHTIKELLTIKTSTPLADYSKKDFLNEVFMQEEDFDKLILLLQTKKNIILQGAPGVGKTFSAKRLAWSIMGEKDNNRIEMVQFHQNYTYEDFILGFKPTNKGGFELKSGIFYDFCKKAEKDKNKEYFFIIDEINRGNLSKIFGELLMLIEKDYRGTDVKLAYNHESFSVPSNLYIIGMMNTADRSLAMIDYALRRRFSFFDIVPGFGTTGFKQYQKVLNSSDFDSVIQTIISLNETIKNDHSLGSGFCIGHSYFCGQNSIDKKWLSNVVEYDILPMLREYWFDNENKYNVEAKKLLNTVI